MAPEPEKLVHELTEAALAAGAAILKVYARAEMVVEAKADASPVTEADLAADAIIAEHLAAAFPDIPAVTEEQSESHTESAPPVFFLVDPLDGTKEFVKRGGDFTVNIALIREGVPVAGVVYAPALGRLFRTGADSGAEELAVADNALTSAPATPLRVSQPDNGALLVVASKSHRDKATDDYISRYSVGEFRSAGSSLKFCLLAAGEADLYPRLGRTMEWDTAAGHAVLAAAGGHVLRFEEQTPLLYGKAGWDNPHFIAHAPGVALA